MLPTGRFNPNDNVPRHYADGLETDDNEEDRMFILWYRKKALAVAEDTESLANASATSSSLDDAPSKNKVPPLGAKRKFAIFRTRSKLERDAWCAALNSTIEVAVRARKERERRLRESGKVEDL